MVSWKSVEYGQSGLTTGNIAFPLKLVAETIFFSNIVLARTSVCHRILWYIGGDEKSTSLTRYFVRARRFVFDD